VRFTKSIVYVILMQRHQPSDVLSYKDLLEELGQKCEGFSGAALAGVARAAASHALERAVNEFSEQANGSDIANESLSIMDCLVSRDDFNEAVEDVLNSMGNSDYADEDKETSEEIKPEEVDNKGDSVDESGGDPISPE
jgi:SpoVK/Ycf46/Vps4 family AAA+-type ATPase